MPANTSATVRASGCGKDSVTGDVERVLLETTQVLEEGAVRPQLQSPIRERLCPSDERLGPVSSRRMEDANEFAQLRGEDVPARSGEASNIGAKPGGGGRLGRVQCGAQLLGGDAAARRCLAACHAIHEERNANRSSSDTPPFSHRRITNTSLEGSNDSWKG